MKIAVIAPHPDDETLGCGGTLLKYKNSGHDIVWIIVTSMSKNDFSSSEIKTREKEIEAVNKLYGFNDVIKLDYAANRLDEYPNSQIVSSVFSKLSIIAPDIILIPFINDIHSDHRIVSKAVLSATKNFRLPCLKKILMYETLSETEFGSNGTGIIFEPNVFNDISDSFTLKCDIFKIYESELMNSPMPRSIDAISALAKYRGSSIGVEYAEAFHLVKEIL